MNAFKNTIFKYVQQSFEYSDQLTMFFLCLSKAKNLWNTLNMFNKTSWGNDCYKIPKERRNNNNNIKKKISQTHM